MSLPLLSVLPQRSQSSATILNPGGAPRTSKKRSAIDEQVVAVKAMCKTFESTTQKLMYAFAAVSEIHADADGVKVTTVDAALAFSGRAQLVELMAKTLAAGVEKIISSSDISMRSAVVRDLRARFLTKEKPTQAEAGCQVELGGPPAKQQRISKENKLEEAPFQWPSAKLPALALEEEEPESEPEEAEAHPSSTKEANSAAALKAGVSTAMYERLKAWEDRKKARVERERKRAEEEERKELEKRGTARPASSNLYAHIESKIKKERVSYDDTRVAQADAKAMEESHARELAEKVAEYERQQAVAAEAARQSAEQAKRDAEVAAQKARHDKRQAERKYELLKHEVDRDNKARADAQEIAEALEWRQFESWPMLPGKKVLRVKEAEEFDGRVSAEFRCKDDESGDKGVSLLMGRVFQTHAVEPQCVLFDEATFSDLEAARWWVRNAHRKCFELSKTGLILQRVRSAGVGKSLRAAAMA